MNTFFIVNRTAGRNKAAAIWKKLEMKALELFPSAEIVFTQRPGHAREIAAAHPGEKIIVVGGDGTFHEALQGAYGKGTVMGIVPAGSGNDLTRALGLPREPAQALSRAALGIIRTIDLGKVNGEYFVNGAGAGFDARVTADVNAGFRFSSQMEPYYLALLRNLLFYRGVRARITGTDYTYEGSLLTLIAGNGNYLGGGIKVVPEARPDDGKLSFCLVADTSVLKRLLFFAKVKKGTHERIKVVHLFNDTSVRIDTDPPVLIHADGEICGATPVTFKVIPQALQVLV